MTTPCSPRLILQDDGRLRIEPAGARWCYRCGALSVVDDHGFCQVCAKRPRHCAECGRTRRLNAAERCKPCAATEAAEARRVADLVLTGWAQRPPQRDLQRV